MVANIQVMVQMILANQEKSHPNQQQHDHPEHSTQVRPTPSPFHIPVPPQNFSPRYTEGETVRRTGFVRWPQEDQGAVGEQGGDQDQNSLVRWEEFVTKYDVDYNRLINNGSVGTNVNSDVDYSIDSGIPQGKEIDNVPSEAENNFIGPEALQREEPLQINKFFK